MKTGLLFTFLLGGVLSSAALAAPAAIDIGSRRELFVDDFLIERLAGKAELRLHHPQPQELVMVLDEPWEGTGSGGYYTVFRDGDIYRMFYKGWNIAFDTKTKKHQSSPSAMCYAESDDGIRWRKPTLGLVEFKGSKENNIVLADGLIAGMRIVAGVSALVKDDNPDAAPDARYKAFTLSAKPKGLLPLKSADGLTWSPMADKPVITNGAFDNQNVAFWSPAEKAYRIYWRVFAHGDNNTATANPIGVRSIRTATSKDFVNWDEGADLTYVDSPEEALYHTPLRPYERAPHIILGFPARYIERDEPASDDLPEPEHRQLRKSVNKRYGTALTEALLMASRDGVRFKRWNEAFLRPGIERPGTWNYGHQFLAWQPIETKSLTPGAPNELSLYATESYWTGNSSEVRRYTLRLDGFVSVQAPMKGGELLTKPLTFSGKELSLNFSTSAAGDIRVEIQDADGRPLPGFTLEECHTIFGDTLARSISWKGSRDVSALAGRPVRLRVVLRDADLYSFRFQP